jgi:hypothetical protein
MSSFVCSSLHYNQIEHALIKKTNRGLDALSNMTAKEVTNFVNTLYALNRETTSNKYGDDPKQYKRSKRNFNFLSDSHITDVELLKALDCVVYQIELHHLTDDRELKPSEKRAMDLLDKIRDELAHLIVYSTMEYQRAPWEAELARYIANRDAV